MVALDAIGSEAAASIIAKVIAQAREGDTRAAEIILRRCWPEAKGRPIAFKLPLLTKPSDLPAALAGLTAQVSNGELSPEEGQAVAGILETHRKALELCQIEERLVRLETRLQQSE